MADIRAANFEDSNNTLQTLLEDFKTMNIVGRRLENIFFNNKNGTYFIPISEIHSRVKYPEMNYYTLFIYLNELLLIQEEATFKTYELRSDSTSSSNIFGLELKKEIIDMFYLKTDLMSSKECFLISFEIFDTLISHKIGKVLTFEISERVISNYTTPLNAIDIRNMIEKSPEIPLEAQETILEVSKYEIPYYTILKEIYTNRRLRFSSSPGGHSITLENFQKVNPDNYDIIRVQIFELNMYLGKFKKFIGLPKQDDSHELKINSVNLSADEISKIKDRGKIEFSNFFTGNIRKGKNEQNFHIKATVYSTNFNEDIKNIVLVKELPFSLFHISEASENQRIELIVASTASRDEAESFLMRLEMMMIHENNHLSLDLLFKTVEKNGYFYEKYLFFGQYKIHFEKREVGARHCLIIVFTFNCIEFSEQSSMLCNNNFEFSMNYKSSPGRPSETNTFFKQLSKSKIIYSDSTAYTQHDFDPGTACIMRLL